MSAAHGPIISEKYTLDVTRILSFWFDHQDGLVKWFKPSPVTDDECRAWELLVLAARAGTLDAWMRTADGTLALPLLLDQLPRNIYRGTAAAYAAYTSEGAALNVALDAIARAMTGASHWPARCSFICRSCTLSPCWPR